VTKYQYVVINDDLERAVERVSAVIDAEGARRGRIDALDERVATLVDHLEREIGKP
jgi:guanylate kinase